MKFVNFEGSNVNLVAPIGMTEEQVRSIPAMRYIDDNLGPCVLTVHNPSPEDIASIVAGNPIYLTTMGEGRQPVSLFTVSPSGEANPE